jgi:hypothetical protein
MKNGETLEHERRNATGGMEKIEQGVVMRNEPKKMIWLVVKN